MTKGLDTTKHSKAWGVIQAHGFGGEAVTVLRTTTTEKSQSTNGEGGMGMESTTRPSNGEVNGLLSDASKDGDVDMHEDSQEQAQAAFTLPASTSKAEKDEGGGTKDDRKGAMFVCWEHAAAL